MLTFASDGSLTSTGIVTLPRGSLKSLTVKEEVVVKINRTAKVTSRGKRFRFSALVVVGDGNGHVGVGLGKANEVIAAIQKGKEIAKRNIVRVCVINGIEIKII